MRRSVSQAANQRAMRRKRGHQNARASGIVFQRGEMLAADFDQLADRVVRQLRGEISGEFADRAVNDGAAVGGAGRRVDRIELAQPQDVLGIDRVGIAQPVLDLGDRELRRPRVARRLAARALRRSLDLRRLVELARPLRHSARRARAPRSSAPRRRPRRAAARSARRPSARRQAWRRAEDHLAARRAPARNRAQTAQCAAPAGRARARGASAGSATDRRASPAARRPRPARRARRGRRPAAALRAGRKMRTRTPGTPGRRTVRSAIAASNSSA